MPVTAAPAPAMCLRLSREHAAGARAVHGAIEQVGIRRTRLVQDVYVEVGRLLAQAFDDALARQPLHWRHQTVASAMQLVNVETEVLSIS